MLCITTSNFTSFKASLVNTVVATVVYSHVVTAAGAVLFHGTFATACWLLLRYSNFSCVCVLLYCCMWNDIHTDLYACYTLIFTSSFCIIRDTTQYSCNFVATKARITYNWKLFISYALALKQFGRALFKQRKAIREKFLL